MATTTRTSSRNTEGKGKDIVIISHFCMDFSESDNDRFFYLSKLLSEKHSVELITSDFFHAIKKKREKKDYKFDFKLTFLDEPKYFKNVCLKRFYSHYCWGRNVYKYLQTRNKPDVVYCAVPSLTAASLTAGFCNKNKIKYVIDVQDLWPEAYQMVFNIPVISRLVFLPFTLMANHIYQSADAVVAVSNTYVNRVLQSNHNNIDVASVYLGTDLKQFDRNVEKNNITKPSDEMWLGYCGTLGSSYNIKLVIDALAEIKGDKIVPRLIIIGDGPLRESFEQYAIYRNVDAEFTGRLPYDKACAMLSACDIAVNPITKGAAGSIINKHGDYAAAGIPVLNTQENEEYRNLVEEYDMGINCSSTDSHELAAAIRELVNSPEKRARQGNNARKCASDKFDRNSTYDAIINILEKTDKTKNRIE